MNGMTAGAPVGHVGASASAADLAGLTEVLAATDAASCGTALQGVAWHISTRSADNGGSCVEAGRLADGSGRVAVRHSHHRDGAVLVYSGAAWKNFLGGIKNGEFDLP